MKHVLTFGLLALVSSAAGGCCCLSRCCPDPCPPPCPAPACPTPACPTPAPAAIGAPVLPAPAGTYAPAFQGSRSRSELAGAAPQSRPTGGPVSTMLETLRSWTVSPVSTPTRSGNAAPPRPLAISPY